MRGTLAWLTGGLALLTLAADTSAAAKPGLLVTHFQPLTVVSAPASRPNERVVVTVVLGKDKHALRSVRGRATRGRVPRPLRRRRLAPLRPAVLGCPEVSA